MKKLLHWIDWLEKKQNLGWLLMTEFFIFLLLWDIVVNEVVERIEVFFKARFAAILAIPITAVFVALCGVIVCVILVAISKMCGRLMTRFRATRGK